MQTDKDRLNDSYSALERKAQLYDKLSKGQYDDDEEQYNVDFLAKGFTTDQMKPVGSSSRQSTNHSKPIDTYSMALHSSGLYIAILDMVAGHTACLGSHLCLLVHTSKQEVQAQPY